MKRYLNALLALSLLTTASPAWADDSASAEALPPPTAGVTSLDGVADEDDDEDDEDDDSEEEDILDDILYGEETEESVEEEQEAVRSGAVEAAAITEEVPLSETDRPRRIIKTIQKKNFLKLGRFELTPNLAFVTNDPFIRRYILGAGFSYHVTEIYALEMNLGFSPILGDGDWKPLTTQLVEENHVSPDLAPLQFFGNTTFAFSPIYGKAAISGATVINFDIFGAFGMGFARTVDDLEALQAEGEDEAMATQYQVHPTTNFGGGARVIFGESFAVRLEGRSLVYIETVNSTTLEMKNNFILQLGVSFFFPGMD